MAAEMRGFKAASGVPDEDRPRSQGRLLGLSSSGRGNSNAALEDDLTHESPGRLPALIVAIEARARSAETEEPPEFPDPTTDPTPSEEGPAPIPVLILGHRSAVGPHGEIVWEPTFAQMELVPLLPPSEGWEAVERFLLPSLLLTDEDSLRVARLSGGYSRIPNGPECGHHRSLGIGTSGSEAVRGRLASALRHRLPTGRGQPLARA